MRRRAVGAGPFTSRVPGNLTIDLAAAAVNSNHNFVHGDSSQQLRTIKIREGSHRGSGPRGWGGVGRSQGFVSGHHGRQ
jgi:hypothetical protein